MNKSRVHMFDTVENVFKHSAELSKIGLNVPQITQVFMGLKAKGYTVDDSVYTVDKAFEVLNKMLGGKRNA